MSRETPRTKTRGTARPSRRPAAPKPKKEKGAKGSSPRGKLDLPNLGATLAAHRTPVIACAVLLALFVALYGPACGLYQAWRENGELRAEQERSSSESSELEGDISSLMSEEGIKDEARRHGYVEEGETRIVVEGAEEEGSQTDEAQDDEVPWYLRVGDFVFQYHEDSEEDA